MKREIYYLTLTEGQMEELQNVLKQERQRIAEGKPGNPRATRLKSIQKALDRSVYFHAKHRAMGTGNTVGMDVIKGKATYTGQSR